jgi:hypothetical protein
MAAALEFKLFAANNKAARMLGFFSFPYGKKFP